MNNAIDCAIERLYLHAWGTSDMRSSFVLSDVLLRFERDNSVDLNAIRSIVLDDLQLLNDAFRSQNPEERQPAFVSLKLTYAMSKIISLLLDLASKLDYQRSSQIVSIARDFSNAWYCVLSCDIENVKDGI